MPWGCTWFFSALRLEIFLNRDAEDGIVGPFACKALRLLPLHCGPSPTYTSRSSDIMLDEGHRSILIRGGNRTLLRPCAVSSLSVARAGGTAPRALHKLCHEISVSRSPEAVALASLRHGASSDSSISTWAQDLSQSFCPNYQRSF